MISAGGIARRLEGLEAIGAGPGGFTRLAWSEEDVASRAWFEQQAAKLGLEVERDAAGNLWACPQADPPWWAVGSHLDSVRGGGRFDGPLGVACGFEIAAAAERPVAVLSFADEEGARFNTPTFGSKALAGKLDLATVLGRTDERGVTVAEAMRGRGLDPDQIGTAPEALRRLSGFIELHIDQTTELANAEIAAGVVSSLAARRRLEVELRGRADHAGTTPARERRDALSATAHLIIAAEETAAEVDGLTFTASRILAEPNAPTTIAARVRLWLDARAGSPEAIDHWVGLITEEVGVLEARTGVQITIALASRSDGVEFSARVRSALRFAGERVLGRQAPELVCFAGHDAGVLAERIPAGMVLVRNATGVSHSPAERLELEDAALAARVVEQALRDLDESGR